VRVGGWVGGWWVVGWGGVGVFSMCDCVGLGGVSNGDERVSGEEGVQPPHCLWCCERLTLKMLLPLPLCCAVL
jgi:hypothetical protein